ncbi:hypothetical protein ABC502_07565 [Alkalimonas sp. NCh-2]|uniref:hypothetical protein n=1 Tax=Alkalimonas sp. NCh-2 TaxID=3144846 RepID=UPI0031F62C22
MLRIYHRIATMMQPAFWLILVLAVLSGAAFIWQVLSAEQPHQSSVLLWLLAMLASLGCLLVIKLFVQPAPEQNAKAGFFQRLKIRLIRLGYYLLALMTTLILLAIVLLGLRVGTGALLRLLLGH